MKCLCVSSCTRKMWTPNSAVTKICACTFRKLETRSWKSRIFHFWKIFHVVQIYVKFIVNNVCIICKYLSPAMMPSASKFIGKIRFDPEFLKKKKKKCEKSGVLLETFASAYSGDKFFMSTKSKSNWLEHWWYLLRTSSEEFGVCFSLGVEKENSLKRWKTQTFWVEEQKTRAAFQCICCAPNVGSIILFVLNRSFASKRWKFICMNASHSAIHVATVCCCGRRAHCIS